MNIKILLNILALAICMLPGVSPAIALLIGIIFSITGVKISNIKKYTSSILQISVVLLGFGMNLTDVITAAGSSFITTAISVSAVMIIGIILGKILKVDSKITLLISCGTAICGGSAIAAVSPIINSKENQISFSMIVIFVLNAAALLIFPAVGHYFNMSQETFGNWAAIAIHDTSSVVGAGSIYGDKALQIATIVKLIRALWIIPLSVAISIFTSESKKIKIPWFIVLFALVVVFTYLFSGLNLIYNTLNTVGHRGVVISLFLIGTNVSVKEAQKAGTKSFLLGLILWVIIALGSFLILNR